MFYAFVEVEGTNIEKIKELEGYDSNLHPYSFFDYLCLLDDNSIKYHVRFTPSYRITDDAFDYFFNDNTFAIFYFEKHEDLEW